jgi:hypothetical protein
VCQHRRQQLRVRLPWQRSGRGRLPLLTARRSPGDPDIDTEGPEVPGCGRGS